MAVFEKDENGVYQNTDPDVKNYRAARARHCAKQKSVLHNGVTFDAERHSYMGRGSGAMPGRDDE